MGSFVIVCIFKLESDIYPYVSTHIHSQMVRFYCIHFPFKGYICWSWLYLQKKKKKDRNPNCLHQATAPGPSDINSPKQGLQEPLPQTWTSVLGWIILKFLTWVLAKRRDHWNQISLGNDLNYLPTWVMVLVKCLIDWTAWCLLF